MRREVVGGNTVSLAITTYVRFSLAAVIAAALLVAVPGADSVARSPRACRVRNVESGIVYRSIQRAVWKAHRGDHLRLRGTCRGTTTMEEDLWLRGERRNGSGTPTLDGDGQGPVLTIGYHASVHVKNLTIRNGFQYGSGGGLYVERWASAYLRDVKVRDNRATSGGGIHAGGFVALTGSTSVFGNTAFTVGDEIHVPGDRNNIGDGGGVMSRHHLYVDRSTSVHHNRAERDGGGIWATQFIELHGSASVADNVADRHGGGILARGHIDLYDAASITGNTAETGPGGGVHVRYVAQYTCGSDPGARVHGNSPDDCYETNPLE